MRFPEIDFVDEGTSGRRLLEAIELHRGIQRAINEAELGGVREVLVEKAARTAGDVLGRTDTGKAVVFPGPEQWANSYRNVRLCHTTGATFIGEVTACAP